jgi:protein-tyrosine phosphatase
VVGVRESYLDAARNEMESRYSDIETYFSKGLGISSQAIDALRNDLVVTA